MAHASLELSDKQIDELLSAAEVRLANASSAKALASTNSQVAKPASPPARQVGESPGSTGELSVRTPRFRNGSKQANKDDAGSGWYNMPRTRVTPELKRDLALIRMRSIVNQKQFFRKDTRKDLIPEFSHVGTIVEGPTEFYSSRLTRKERKQTIVEEALASGEALTKFKSRYDEIQERKMSGKKAYYKKMVSRRRGRG